MMLLALLAAATPVAAPVVPYAEARSSAYRDCVVEEQRRRPALTVAQIGRRSCGRARSKLVAAARDHVAYGWLATAKSAGQARRLKAQLKVNAEAEVVRFETRVQAWLAGTESAGGGR